MAKPVEKKLRRDAQESIAKLRAAAIATFSERGLGAPLEDIARQAGVSTGTLYNRFGSREALIDSVLADLTTAKLGSALLQLPRKGDAWTRFATFVRAMFELQSSDPVLNDAISQRYPDAASVRSVCEKTLDAAAALIAEAQAAGSLRADFTSEDMFFALWSHAQLIRARAGAPEEARGRYLEFFLEGLRSRAKR